MGCKKRSTKRPGHQPAHPHWERPAMHAKREQMPGLKEDLDRYYHHRCTRLKA